MSNFTHLHVHTEYSLLDGVNKSSKLINKVKSLGMEAVAISDHGVMYGVPEFWEAAKEIGVKPIIGCEVYLSPSNRGERKEVNGIKYYHLLLLAKNQIGYQNLVKLVTAGHLEGMYYKPRIDIDLLKKHSEGLVCTSACLAGPINRHILRDELDIAENWLHQLHSIFKDDFYLEVQRLAHSGKDEFDDKYLQIYDSETINLIKEQIKVNVKLREYSEKFNIPLVATTDAHYLEHDDKEVQQILFGIKDGLTLDNPRARKGYEGTYIRTFDEMKEIYADDISPVTNTLNITDKIETFDISFDRVQPIFWNIPKNKTAGDILREQTYEGARRKYGELTDSVKERIEYELGVIHDKGYDDYFLIVSDIMKWSAKNGILTGVRGSVAGSVVAYTLDIVAVDPIAWELYFERFLNPERPSPPDIDMDIQDSRRDELIEYVKEKYGEDSIAAICAIGRLKTKAAIRDVARVMGIDLATADRLSKMVNVVFGKVFTIDKMIETDPEFASIINSDERLQQLAKYVKKIENMARHMSVHACGHLITPGPIVNYTPLQLESGGGRTITQLEGPWIEKIGLMKFDFLGLRTLTILSDAIKIIKERHGIEIDFWNIPNDDKKTFQLFSRGETIGIFQFESPPMQQYMKDLQPENQEDLCFLVAAYRPGAMKYIPDYIKIKHKEKEISYLVPELKPITEVTNGYLIYQEQLIRISVDLAGYTMGQADSLRKAVGKKKLDVMEKEAVKFKEGIINNGFNQEIADKLWEMFLPFADYGFNKAHAAGYAVLAYKSAYLKANYPLEFMAAAMHSDLQDLDRISLEISEARRTGFKVLPPSVNESDTNFSIVGNDTIRFGLGAIKNVGIKVCEKIVEERKNGKFRHFDDFVYRVGTSNLNRRSLESLIQAGALDEFADRNALLRILDEVMDKAHAHSKAEMLGQTSLFYTSINDIDPTPIPNVEVSTERQRLDWENELMGLFVSTHPLNKFKWTKLTSKFVRVSDLENLENRTQVKIVGMLEDIKHLRTKSKNELMALTRISDLSGKTEAVIFPRSFEEYNKLGLLAEFKPLIITATINVREDRKSLIIDALETANSLTVPKKIVIDLTTIKDKAELENLKYCFTEDGNVDVEILYGSKYQPKKILRKIDYNNDWCIDTLSKYVV